MASAEAALLMAQVKIRIDNDMLVRFTNDQTTKTATTINETRLLAVCDDVIGKFGIESGHEFSIDDQNHVPTCVAGVMMMLEQYKGKSTNLTSVHAKSFFAACRSLRDKTAFLAQTDSEWEPSDAIEGLPDMDKDQVAFRRMRVQRR